jgi:hypothetical protein
MAKLPEIQEADEYHLMQLYGPDQRFMDEEFNKPLSKTKLVAKWRDRIIKAQHRSHQAYLILLKFKEKQNGKRPKQHSIAG